MQHLILCRHYTDAKFRTSEQTQEADVMAVMLVQAEAAVMAGWQALQQQADSTVLTMPEHECNNHIPLYVAGTPYLTL